MFGNKIIFLITIIALSLFLGCQPEFVKKRPSATSEVDSVLFYQKKDVADPFIDGLLSNSDQPVILKKTVAPPPAPKKNYREAQGFRVQVFAGIDSLNALQQLKKLSSVVSDSCYLIKEKDLFKVQAGDFVKRYKADSLREAVKKDGFPGAWVLQTTVYVYNDNTELLPETVESSSASGKYQIQVFATSDESKAKDLVTRLSQQFDYPAHYESKNNLYKVFLGKFATREQADKILQEIKNLGFPDAWIVH